LILSCLLALLIGTLHLKCNNSSDKTSGTKYKQYYIKGESLYTVHCSNCHQKDGSGLGLLYPPLNQSDYMASNKQKVICIIRNGLQGEIKVNGKVYNKVMPPIPSLSDIEVAQIATYIYNTWTHQEGLMEVKDVSAVLQNCNTN